MRMAETARRSTWSSMAMEFDRRIFDVWSWDVKNELLAGVDVGRTAWQTTGAILPPPPRGLRSRTEHRRWWKWGKCVIKIGPILGDQMIRKEENSVSERHATSGDAFLVGGHSLVCEALEIIVGAAVVAMSFITIRELFECWEGHEGISLRRSHSAEG